MESVRCQKRIVMFIDQNVGGFQIRMHKGLQVQVRDAVGDGERQLVSLRPVQGAFTCTSSVSHTFRAFSHRLESACAVSLFL